MCFGSIRYDTIMAIGILHYTYSYTLYGRKQMCHNDEIILTWLLVIYMVLRRSFECFKYKLIFIKTVINYDIHTVYNFYLKQVKVTQISVFSQKIKLKGAWLF